MMPWNSNRPNSLRSEWVIGISLEKLISEKTGLHTHDVQFLCDFFEDGKEVPYIYRYKLKNHEHLQLEQLRFAKEEYNFARNLNRGVSSLMSRVLPGIANRDERRVVRKRMENITNKEDLEFMESEFNKPSEISKRAAEARALGLEPVAESILNGKFVSRATCAEFQLDLDEFMSYLRVLIADIVNMDEEVKVAAKKVAVDKLWSNIFWIIIYKTKTRADGTLASRIDSQLRIPSEDDIHVISKLERGVENQKLRWEVDVPKKEVKELHPMFGRKVNERMQRWFDEIVDCEILAYFANRIARKAKSHLQDLSIYHGCRIHRENLFQLFQQRGIRGTYVIGLDPGFDKTKAALIDHYGKYMGGKNFRLEVTLPFEETKFTEKGEVVIVEWVEMAKAAGRDVVFAVGDGKNHCHVQKAVWSMKARGMFVGVDADVYLVSETGASWHSVSDIGINEFPPSTRPGQISAASIARRLQAPKSEYSKLAPHKLSLGQYQNSMPAPELVKNMGEALRERISLDGVDLNLASMYVLQHVCGLNEQLARDIVRYREEHGAFQSRVQLKNVQGVTEDVFEQCAGSLKIENGENPLDNTFIHPNDYERCERMFDDNFWSVEYLQTTEHLVNGLSDEELNYIKLIREVPESVPEPKCLTSPLAPILYPLNTKLIGIVRCVTTFGVFITLPLGLDSKTDGLAGKHLFRVGHTIPAKYEFPKIGEEIEVVIYRTEREDDELLKYFCAPADRVPKDRPLVDFNRNVMKRRSMRW